MKPKKKIRLIIFDISGTIIDHGSLATIYAFKSALSKYGIKITNDIIKIDMGIRKIDHLKKILKHNIINSQWKVKFNKNPTKRDIDTIIKIFDKKLKIEVLRRTSYIQGFTKLVNFLRIKNIKIGLTTGYPKNILNLILKKMRLKGFRPDYSVSSSEVKRGRPHPDMTLKVMKKLNISTPSEVIKVDDSLSGIQEGKKAKVHTVGILLSGINLAMSKLQRKKLKPSSLKKLRKININLFKKVKTDFLIDDISELKNLINNKI